MWLAGGLCLSYWLGPYWLWWHDQDEELMRSTQSIQKYHKTPGALITCSMCVPDQRVWLGGACCNTDRQAAAVVAVATSGCVQAAALRCSLGICRHIRLMHRETLLGALLGAASCLALECRLAYAFATMAPWQWQCSPEVAAHLQTRSLHRLPRQEQQLTCVCVCVFVHAHSHDTASRAAACADPWY